jgi:hypothetical protein
MSVIYVVANGKIQKIHVLVRMRNKMQYSDLLHETRKEIIDTDLIPSIKQGLKRIAKYISKAKHDYIAYMEDASLGVGY